MKPRGWSLIELMLSLSLLTILVLTGVNAAAAQRTRAIDLALRERARQVLELEAGARIEGRVSDEAVRQKLLSELPDAQFAVVEKDRVVRLVVHWREAIGGRRTLSLRLLRPLEEVTR